MGGVAEKKDGKHSDSQRKYRLNKPHLKYAYLYFEDGILRKTFDKACAERQYQLFDHELMSRQGTSGVEHSFIGSGRKVERIMGKDNHQRRNNNKNSDKQDQDQDKSWA